MGTDIPAAISAEQFAGKQFRIIDGCFNDGENTWVPQSWARDRSLSWEAAGVLMLAASLGAFTFADLCIGPDPLKVHASALAELLAAGYVLEVQP
jgi:hypothetical protein